MDAQTLVSLSQKLDPPDITLVVHDFGGPIGLAVGIENSERIKRVVLFNSWLWATNEGKQAQKIDKTLNSGPRPISISKYEFISQGIVEKGFCPQEEPI